MTSFSVQSLKQENDNELVGKKAATEHIILQIWSEKSCVV